MAEKAGSSRSQTARFKPEGSHAPLKKKTADLLARIARG